MAHSLIPIPNQPIRFRPYNQVSFCKKPEAPQAYLHMPNDPIRFQIKQSPCGANALCNSSFDGGEAFGTELVTNGGFTGSAASWTLAFGCAYNSNNIQVATDSQGHAQQALAIAAGTKYRVTFTMNGMTSGYMAVRLGGEYAPTFTTNGVHSVDIIAGSFDSLIFFEWHIAHGTTIDDVSVRELTLGADCWNSSEVNWTFDGAKACHLAGSSAELVNTSVLSRRKYYQVVIRISGRTTGGVQLKLCGATSSLITANGSFVKYITSGNTSSAFSIVPSSDFDGCIDSVYAYKLLSPSEITIEVIKYVDGVANSYFWANSATFITNDEDRLNFKIDGLNNIGIYNHFDQEGLPHDIHQPEYGCYAFRITDNCATGYTNTCDEETDYESQIIMYQQSFEGTNLVLGQNNPLNGLRKYAFGFLFSQDFYLIQRLVIGFRKPKYPSKFEIGKYSIGYHYKNYTETEKIFELVFDQASEMKHDAIAVQINCKQFSIVKDGCIRSYFNMTEEYSPEWDAKGVLLNAQARIEVVEDGSSLATSFMPNELLYLTTELGSDILTEDNEDLIAE